MSEFLEKNYKEDMTRDETIKLTVKSLLEVVQTGARNIEITVMDGFERVSVRLQKTFTSAAKALTSRSQNLELGQIESIVAEIEREKEAGKRRPCPCFVSLSVLLLMFLRHIQRPSGGERD